MVKGTNFLLRATSLVALDSLILRRMVKPLDHGVAFLALQATWALIPAYLLLQGDLTVFSVILE
jgi:hypothetical protein